MTVDQQNQEETKQLKGYDDIENGPMSEAHRECRDIICLILFVAVLGGMGYLSIYGYTQGNPNNVFRATDSNGVVCGLPGGVAESYPYAYFYNPTSGDLSNRYCVQSCPSYSGSTLSTLTCYGQSSCTYSITITPSGTYSTNPSTTTQIIGYDSSALISRVCVPSSTVFTGVFSSYSTTFSTYLNQGDLANFITDVQNNWKWLLAAAGACILISFIFMFTLRCIAGLIVWTSIFGIIIFFALAGIVFLYNAGMLTALSSYSGYLNIPSLSGATTQTYAIFGYVSFGLSALFLLILICCFGRIKLAVAVCKAAGQFIVGVCFIVLVPIFQTILTLGLWAAALITMVYLVSAATFTASSGSVFTSISDYGDPNLIRMYTFIFGTLWSNAFIQAMGTFVVASACCMWYYSHGPGQELSFPILRSYKMIFRYHFGSLAFGSLILAIVQFLQLVVQAVKKQAEANGASQNKVFEYVINCLRCCMACVERIVQFLNKTAYIQIALRGKSFCNAAKDGFELVWSNPIRYAIVGGVGEIIMFLGKLMIAAATTAAFYLLITYTSSIKSNVLQPIYLLVVVFIVSFTIGMLFMSVYSLAMDTLLQCFIVDQANQKAKGGKTALYAPEEFADLIDVDQEKS